MQFVLPRVIFKDTVIAGSRVPLKDKVWLGIQLCTSSLIAVDPTRHGEYRGSMRARSRKVSGRQNFVVGLVSYTLMLNFAPNVLESGESSQVPVQTQLKFIA